MKVIFFEDENGSPPWQFLHSLPVKIRVRFYGFLEHLKANEGKDTNGIAFRKLHDYPMEEIRVKSSRNLHRLVIQVRIGDSILVLHGFTKKEGQATPQKELEIAKERLIKFISKS